MKSVQVQEGRSLAQKIMDRLGAIPQLNVAPRLAPGVVRHHCFLADQGLRRECPKGAGPAMVDMLKAFVPETNGNNVQAPETKSLTEAAGLSGCAGPESWERIALGGWQRAGD